MRIYKYPIQFTEMYNGLPMAEITLPAFSHILDVQLQNDFLTLWAEVDPTNETVTRNFVRVMTGQDFYHDNLKYIKTYQQGWFVGHIYEVMPEED